MAVDFTFTISLRNESRLDELVEQVASAVFRQVGCAPPAARELLLPLHEAVALTPGAEWCGVQFRVQAGELEVTVRSGSGGTWRVSRPIS